MLYKIALTIEEFKINELKARIGKPLHRMKITNFYLEMILEKFLTLELMEE